MSCLCLSFSLACSLRVLSFSSALSSSFVFSVVRSSSCPSTFQLVYSFFHLRPFTLSRLFSLLPSLPTLFPSSLLYYSLSVWCLSLFAHNIFLSFFLCLFRSLGSLFSNLPLIFPLPLPFSPSLPLMYLHLVMNQLLPTLYFTNSLLPTLLTYVFW
jgi:hypothetical protein